MTPAALALLLTLLQPGPLPLCTPEEYAAYEAQGWDAYECDGDALERLADSLAQAHEDNAP